MARKENALFALCALCLPNTAARRQDHHSTDSEDSIRWRHDYLLRKFLEAWGTMVTSNAAGCGWMRANHPHTFGDALKRATKWL
jgi:hypothetical protein